MGEFQGWAFAAALALAAGPAVAGMVHAAGDWSVRHDDGDPDHGRHYCEAFTVTPRGAAHFQRQADGGLIMIIAHAGWRAPHDGVEGGYQLAIDGGTPWRIGAMMHGATAVTVIDAYDEGPSRAAVARLQASLAVGGVATLLSEDGATLDRFSLRGSAAAFAAQEQCAMELLPQEWGEEADMGSDPVGDVFDAELASIGDMLGDRGVPARFEDHPPLAWLAGAPVAPDFSGRDVDFRTMRTRLRDAVARGVNFGGHYALVEVGCGTSCHFAMIVDLRTGEVGSFPYGGEDYYGMSLRFDDASRLVTAQWRDFDAGDICVEEDLVIEGMTWRPLGRRIEPSDGMYCD